MVGIHDIENRVHAIDRGVALNKAARPVEKMPKKFDKKPTQRIKFYGMLTVNCIVSAYLPPPPHLPIIMISESKAKVGPNSKLRGPGSSIRERYRVNQIQV